VKLLILRPEPGASETAARAREMGLEAVVAPLFAIRPIPGPAVEADLYDAVLITSANGARHAPDGLAALPCFAVGERSAAAARAAGFADVRAGPSDGAAAAALMAAAGARRALHLCGSDRVAVSAPGVAIERRAVYSAEPVPQGPFPRPAVALIHSPRAGSRFAALAGDRAAIAIAAISAAAADAAGEGWAARAIAAEPRDHALLELAAKLCKYGREAVKDGGDGI
jgi:uroporphyrinogen-III synthase